MLPNFLRWKSRCKFLFFQKVIGGFQGPIRYCSGIPLHRFFINVNVSNGRKCETLAELIDGCLRPRLRPDGDFLRFLRPRKRSLTATNPHDHTTGNFRRSWTNLRWNFQCTAEISRKNVTFWIFFRGKTWLFGSFFEEKTEKIGPIHWVIDAECVRRFVFTFRPFLHCVVVSFTFCIDISYTNSTKRNFYQYWIGRTRRNIYGFRKMRTSLRNALQHSSNFAQRLPLCWSFMVRMLILAALVWTSKITSYIYLYHFAYIYVLIQSLSSQFLDSWTISSETHFCLNQSINPSIDQSIDQSINWSINRSIDRSTPSHIAKMIKYTLNWKAEYGHYDQKLGR